MRLASVVLLSLLLLAGCAAPGIRSGLTTELAPGEALTVVMWGDDPELQVTSEGPGAVLVMRDGVPGFEIRLGAPGRTQGSLRGGGSFRVVNTSSSRARVSVRTFGADATEIRGPVVPATGPDTPQDPPGTVGG